MSAVQRFSKASVNVRGSLHLRLLLASLLGEPVEGLSDLVVARRHRVLSSWIFDIGPHRWIRMRLWLCNAVQP